MKVKSDVRLIETLLERSAQQAARDTLKDIDAVQARRTGRLIAGSKVVPGRLRGQWFIANDVVYANAVERGVNARVRASVKTRTKRRKGTFGPVLNRRTRRGPHMEGNHLIERTGPRFIQHTDRRLREAMR